MATATPFSDDRRNPGIRSFGGVRNALWPPLIWSSPIARKIVLCNLFVVGVLLCGLLYQNANPDSFAGQAVSQAGIKAGLIAQILAPKLGQEPGTVSVAETAQLLEDLPLRPSTNVLVFDTEGQFVLGSTWPSGSDGVEGAWGNVDVIWTQPQSIHSESAVARQIQSTIAKHIGKLGPNHRPIWTAMDPNAAGYVVAVVPVLHANKVTGFLALRYAINGLEHLHKLKQAQFWQLFAIVSCLCVGLSVLVARTIAKPLAILSQAAERISASNAHIAGNRRIYIPATPLRRDEIGHLSAALRKMVAAFYERIDRSEAFAADVAHEIKNPLASLCSAAAALPNVTRDDHRAALLDVIEHDVRRLDRLISDISSATRTETALARNEEKDIFDILCTMKNVVSHLDEEACAKGIYIFTDFPDQPIPLHGMEGRLAQALVNIIGNAISFCESGDQVRISVRMHDERVLIVVEDTGPGIPETAFEAIFERFYSQRPDTHFGNNSGLGLAISKQIVEAHGGVIWAENICPTHLDATSDPFGARFVIGLAI